MTDTERAPWDGLAETDVPRVQSAANIIAEVCREQVRLLNDYLDGSLTHREMDEAMRQSVVRAACRIVRDEKEAPR